LGGLTKDVPEGALKNLSSYFLSFPERLGIATGIDNTYFSVIDRFETTGKVKEEILSPLHVTGPVARASGKKTDTRSTHPYGLYKELKLKAKTQAKGDVLARFNLKATEVLDSIKIIQRIISELVVGEVYVLCQIKDGYSISIVEAPRGENVHWIQIKNGLIDRYKVRTASFCNWQTMEHAILGNIVPDFPLINKSMNLSYAGTDM
jgi:Ni,Fe-hydrogenase III large subunit